jgi:hypothetical protein
MKKLRKMFGEWQQDEIQSLVKLIGTQSKKTLVSWCIDYAEQNYLQVYEKAKPNDKRPQKSLEAAKAWLRGEIKLPAAKHFILDCHTAAREAEKEPITQAAARAIGQAASSIHTATHALGIAFYGAAVAAYNEAGFEADAEIYDKIAAKEFTKILNSLKKVAVKNEPNPIKVNWHCP